MRISGEYVGAFYLPGIEIPESGVIRVASAALLAGAPVLSIPPESLEGVARHARTFVRML